MFNEPPYPYRDVDVEQVEDVWDELEELQSLGISLKKEHIKGNRDELAALADVIKRSMYQDYKLAYGDKGEEHELEAKATLVA